MKAMASTKFPYLDKWKTISSKNKILEIIDSTISGYAQIAFNDNTFSGLLLIIGTYIASPVQAASGVWATLVGTLTAYFLGISKDLIRAGLYGINPALTGLAIPVLIFPGQGLSFELIIYSTLASIFAVLLTAGLNGLLAKWDVPALALPYSTTLLIFVPASILFRSLSSTISSPRLINIISEQAQDIWSIGEFITASLNGIAQVLWVDNVLTGALYLVAVLMASRIDTISTIVGAVVATAVSIALGLPKDMILFGLYGYNAVLLMKAFSRGYRINVYSYTFAIVLASLSVILSASLRVIFAPIGAISAAAFPYSILCILAFLARKIFKKISYVPPKNWGVPETIKKLELDS